MNKTDKNGFKILSVYTGRDYENIDDVLKDKTALDMLWLEILVNDKVPWEEYWNIPAIRKNYEKASIWYANFKTLLAINGVQRKALKPAQGVFDMREYRKFIGVLNYAYHLK